MQEFKWYVLKTKTNCEERAKQMIEDLVKNKNLQDQIGGGVDSRKGGHTSF